MMPRLTIRLQLPAILTLAALLAAVVLMLTGCRAPKPKPEVGYLSPTSTLLEQCDSTSNDSAAADSSAFRQVSAHSSAFQRISAHSAPDRADYHGFRASARYQKDSEQWRLNRLSPDQYAAVIKPVPSIKAKRGAVVVVATDSARVKLTAGTGKNSATGSGKAKVQNQKGPGQQGLADRGAHLDMKQTPPPDLTTRVATAIATPVGVGLSVLVLIGLFYALYRFTDPKRAA